MNKIILLLSVILLLQGCIASNRTGYVVPENNNYLHGYSSDGNRFYRIEIPLGINENIYISKSPKPDTRTLVLKMPDQIIDLENGGIGRMNKDNVFYVMLKGFPYTDEFINNIDISLINNNVKYQARKNIYKPYASFIFPLKISEIEKYKSVLVIQYKGYRREVPIKYDLL